MRILILFFMSTALLFSANRGMMNLSDLDVEFEVDLDLGLFIESYGEDSYFAGGGLLSTGDGNGNVLYFTHLFIENDLPQVEGVRIAVGMKYITTTVSNYNFNALPVGFDFSYAIPNKNDMPLFLIGTLFYASSPLSFTDAKNYLEMRIGISTEIDDMQGFVEYRSIHTNFNISDMIFNETFYAGGRLSF